MCPEAESHVLPVNWAALDADRTPPEVKAPPVCFMKWTRSHLPHGAEGGTGGFRKAESWVGKAQDQSSSPPLALCGSGQVSEPTPQPVNRSDDPDLPES